MYHTWMYNFSFLDEIREKHTNNLKYAMQCGGKVEGLAVSG